MEHLGGAQGRAGVADQGMRHRAHALFLAEEVRGRLGGAADKPDRAGDPPGVFRADRGGIGHHVRHLSAGAVARIHREERDFRQVGAHCRSVVGRHAGRPELLQQHGFEIDELIERPSHVEDRLAGADP